MSNKPDSYLNQTEFSKQIGFTRQAISKAVGTGTLRQVEFEGNKYIDIESAYTKAYIKEALSKKAGKSSSKKTVVKKKVGKSKSKKKPQNKQTGQSKGLINDGIIDPEVPFGENYIPQFIKDLANSDNLSFEQLYQLPKTDMDKLKIYEQIKQIRVKTQESRKELIERKLVRVLFGKLYEIDVNEFLMLKGKIVPDLASIFECTDSQKMIEAEKRIDTELWKVLKHIKYELDRFLKKHGAEKLEGVK